MTSGPFDTGGWAQDQWYTDAPLWSPSGVWGPPAVTTSTGALGLTVGAAGNGWPLNLAAGWARVRGAAYTGAGWAGAVQGNTDTNPRTDRLVLRRSLANRAVTPTLLTGTPATLPTAPTLARDETGDWDAPLFRWTMPPGGGPPTAVTDERRFLDGEADPGAGVLAFTDFTGNPITLNTADAGLSIYTLPTVRVGPNRRLRLVHTVTLQSTGGANCAYGFRYKLGGNILRSSTVSVPFVDVPETRTITHEIQPAPGDLAFTISGLRVAGTGTPLLLCDANTGPTQFYVEDIGAAP